MDLVLALLFIVDIPISLVGIGLVGNSVILNDFQCKDFNINSFMKYFGGMNKGRPNAEDLNQSEEFALNLKKNL